MKEQTSWPSIFLLLPLYGEEGKEKLDDINVDFGFATYLKNEKSLERNILIFIVLRKLVIYTLVLLRLLP